MRLFLDGKPGLEDPPEALAERAWREVASWAGADELPIYTVAGLSVRFRFVYQLPPGPLEVKPALIAAPAVPTLAWFWTHVLEGLLWRDASQISEVHARAEWGRIAGVEVTL